MKEVTEVAAATGATGASGANGKPAIPRRTSPLGFVAKGLDGLRRAILPMVAVAYGMRDETFGLLTAVGLGLLIAGVAVGIRYLHWLRLTYTVGETDIRVESGLLSRAARSVPFERIQDVSLEQSLIPRLLGLVEVRFETGAGGKDELKLAYLTQAEGEELRELVRARKDGVGLAGEAPVPYADGTVSTPVTEPGSEPLFAMDTRRLVTFGLFEFSLAVVAVIAGAVQQFGDFFAFRLWPASLDNLTDLQDGVAGRFDWLASAGPMMQFIGIAAAIFALLVVGLIVGVATGLVRTVLRDWGFTLDWTDKGFRRRRGLLTRTDVVMPAHRVQAVNITTGIIRKRFGWHGLSFISLAQDSGASNHIVAPFGQMEELAPIVRKAGFDLPADMAPWQRGAVAYRVDAALLPALLLVPAAAITAVVAGPLLAVLPIAGGAFLALRQAFLWRFERHCLTGRQLFISKGWLAPELSIASRIKLQSVEISQNFIGRRRGYATLHLGLAGGKMALRGISPQRAYELRGAILASIAEKDFSQLAQ